MERLKLIITTCTVVFSFAFIVNAQDKPAAKADAKPAAKEADHDKHESKPDSMWKWDVNLDVRANHLFGVGDDGNEAQNDLFFRGILGAKASVQDSLHGYFSVYGLEDPNNDTVLNIYQMWVKWSPSENFRLKAGQFDTSFFGYTDTYRVHPETLKGALAKFKTDFAHISALYSRYSDTVITTTKEVDGRTVRNSTDSDLDYVGLNVKLTQLPEFLSKVKVSYVQQVGNENLAKNDVLNLRARKIHEVGGMLKAGVQGLHLKGGAKVQSGADDHSARLYHAKASYTAAEAMNATLWVNYHQDSVDYQPFFYNQSGSADYSNVLSWGNLTYYGGGVKVSPSDGWYLGGGYSLFSKTDEAGGDAKFYENVRGWKDAGGSKLGSELNFWAKKKFDNGLAIKLRLSRFTAGDAFSNVDDNDDRVELRLVSNF